MKVVVITGSTRGIGFGLAESFLARDCAVVVSGRTNESVENAVQRLRLQDEKYQVLGVVCDVRDCDQVQNLWDRARDRYGKVDIWINNAGLSGPQKLLWEQSSETVQTVIDTNLLGVFNGAQVAMTGMLEQGFGAIYNMEGMGSDGRKIIGLSLYGTTKSALKYFTDALVKEAKSVDAPIIIGALQPGMVVTDLILEPYRGRPEEWQRVKRIFSIIADRVETVTPWLADKMLKNHKSGVRFNWSSSLKIFSRFVLSPFSKRNIFEGIDIEA